MKFSVTPQWLASKLSLGPEPNEFTPVPKSSNKAQCTVCNRKPKGVAPLGENDFWECSHVGCPNRHKVTAAPSDRLPEPKENQ